MDSENFIAPGMTGLIISVVYVVYKFIKHSSCRSTCCGIASSFDMNLTPSNSQAFVDASGGV